MAFDHPSTDIYPAGHGHDDFGSFCAFFKEMQVIIDIGCFSYDITQNEVNGRENACHNVVQVDNKSLLPSGRGINSLIGGIARQKANFCFNNDEKKMLWNVTTNFAVNWSRQVKLNNESLHIYDDFLSTGKKTHSAEGYYYFAPGVQIEFIKNHQWILSYKKIKLLLTLEGADSVVFEETDFYPNYGESRLSHRLSWKSEFIKKNQIRVMVNHYLDY